MDEVIWIGSRTGNEYTIRLGNFEDLNLFRPLAHWTQLDPIEFSLRNPDFGHGHALIAVHNSRLAGRVWLNRHFRRDRSNEDVAIFIDLVTEDEFRRDGVARALLNFGHALADEWNCIETEIAFQPENRALGQGFYIGEMGYRVVNVTLPEDGWVFRDGEQTTSIGLYDSNATVLRRPRNTCNLA